jgi:hypothetical protein
MQEEKGIPRPDIDAFFGGLTDVCAVIVGRRRIGKTFSFPRALMKLHKTELYLDFGVPVDCKQDLATYFRIPGGGSSVELLLLVARALRIPVIADEVQASTFGGLVKKFLKSELSGLAGSFPLSITMFGSHQSRVQAVGTNTLFHVDNTNTHYAPMPPLNFYWKLLNESPDDAPIKIKDLLCHFAAFDRDVQRLGKEGNQLVLEKLAQDKQLETLPKSSEQDLMAMLDTGHLNILLEFSGRDSKPTRKKNPKKKQKNEEHRQRGDTKRAKTLNNLVQFGFLREGPASRIPGQSGPAYLPNYAPLLFRASADRKMPVKQNAGFGPVVEWVVDNFLKPKLFASVGCPPDSRFLHGPGPWDSEIDGLIVHGGKVRAVLSVKMQEGTQSLGASIFKVLANCSRPSCGLILYPSLPTACFSVPGFPRLCPTLPGNGEEYPSVRER